MRYRPLWIMAAATAAGIPANVSGTSAEQSQDQAPYTQAPLCDAKAIKAACGMDIACSAACSIERGDGCHTRCQAQDYGQINQICLKWCGLTECHEYDCYEWRCMAYCEPEYWYGCESRCDNGDVLFCDDVYIAMISDQAACKRALCDARMLSGHACDP